MIYNFDNRVCYDEWFYIISTFASLIYSNISLAVKNILFDCDLLLDYEMITRYNFHIVLINLYQNLINLATNLVNVPY
jgi:hypothetical protein